jgi:flagellar biosynthesis protein FlhG
MNDQAQRLRYLTGQRGLNSTQVVTVHVPTGVYEGEYRCELKEVRASTFLTTLPHIDGRPVFLPVGGRVEVDMGSGWVATEIVGREFRNGLYLEFSRPEAISRNGRPQPAQLAAAARVVAITSGKGGVGKTNLSVNMALALQDMGYKPLLFDADLGLANVDVVLGLVPPYTLVNVLRGERSMRDVVVEGPNGLSIIAGGSGVVELANLSDWQLTRFVNGLNELEGMSDYVIIDTGAGLSRQVLSFIYAADEVIVVTTPEPTALTDAYAVVKLVSQRSRAPMRIVVNRAETPAEAETTFKRISEAADRFLDVPITYLGYIPDDHNIPRAVKDQVPLILSSPRSPAALAVRNLAATLAGKPAAAGTGGLKAYFHRLMQWL